MRYITHESIKYRIRGTATANGLRRSYKGFVEDHPGTKITFKGWLVGYGHVHSSIRKSK